MSSACRRCILRASVRLVEPGLTPSASHIDRALSTRSTSAWSLSSADISPVRCGGGSARCDEHACVCADFFWINFCFFRFRVGALCCRLQAARQATCTWSQRFALAFFAAFRCAFSAAAAAASASACSSRDLRFRDELALSLAGTAGVGTSGKGRLSRSRAVGGGTGGSGGGTSEALGSALGGGTITAS